MDEIRIKSTTLSISDNPMRIQRSSDTIIPCLVKNPETVDFSTKSINFPHYYRSAIRLFRSGMTNLLFTIILN